MPVRQEFDKSVRGLYGNYNHVSGVPEGGLLEARDCVIDRPGVLSKRRGFNRYGPQLEGYASALFEYKDSLVVLDGAQLKYDSDGAGTLTAWDGSFSSPDSTHKMRGVEKMDNLYITTSRGVYKNDTLANSPRRAGMPEGLDMKLSTSGSNGWFEGGKQVGYRMIWSREDENENLLLGSPSYKVEITNRVHEVTLTNPETGIGVVQDPGHGLDSDDIVTIESNLDTVSGYDATNVKIVVVDADSYRYALVLAPEELLESVDGSVKLNRDTVTVEFSVPDDIFAADKAKYEIYRTLMQPLTNDYGYDPGTGDDLFRVVKKKVTAAEIDAKKVIFEDVVEEIDLDALALYTSQIRETMSQSNDRPPYCKDMAHFKGYMFASSLRFRQQAEIKLEETLAYDQTTLAPIMALGDSLSINVDGKVRTYKLASKEVPSRSEFLLSTTESSPAANVRETMKSLVRVINRHPTDAELYAHYSSLEQDAPGKVLLKARRLEIPVFYITASSTAFGDLFEEEIPTSGQEIKSSDSERKNGLAFSKVDEPEAFAPVDVFSIGSEESEIHRIIPLRDSLIILKSDGIYRLTGETKNSFSVRDLDKTANLEAVETAVALNNAVFCLSTQGVIKVDENGTQAISWPIEVNMSRTEDFPGQAKVSFAVGYETERKFILWAPSAAGALLASKAWVYNYLTREWTTWVKPAKCAYVLRRQDKLYVGHAEDQYILQERKSSVGRDNLEDYMDESIGTTMTGYGTTTDADGKTVSTVVLVAAGQKFMATTQPYIPAWDYPRELREGFLFSTTAESDIAGDDQIVTVRSKVASVSIATSTGSAGVPTLYQATLTLKDDLGFSGSAGRVVHITLPIDSYVRWAPEDGGMRAMMKQFTYGMVSLEENKALTHELGFYTDVVPQHEWVDTINLTPPVGWGKGPWGADPWGDNDIRSTPLVTAVPRQHQRCRALTFMYRHRTALEKFDIQAKSLSFRPYGGKLVRKSV